MPLWTIQMTVFNLEAETEEQAFSQAYEQIVDDAADLIVTEMQPGPYKFDFSGEAT